MDYDEAVSFLVKKLQKKPSVFIIYSNALGEFPDILDNRVKFSCDGVIHFPQKKRGCLSPYFIFGKHFHKYILVLQGRYHLADGYSVDEIVFPVKIAHLLGCRKMLVTNAAGSVNKKLELGDIMLIKDQINIVDIVGDNPLKMFNENRKKIKETRNIYDENFMTIARKLSVNEGMDKYVKTGTYAMINLTNMKNSFDVVALKTLGVDAVGASMIPEVITAVNLKMAVFGMSIMTDKGILDYKNHPDPLPEEISRALEPKKDFIRKLISRYIRYCRTAIFKPEDVYSYCSNDVTLSR